MLANLVLGKQRIGLERQRKRMVSNLEKLGGASSNVLYTHNGILFNLKNNEIHFFVITCLNMEDIGKWKKWA